MSSLQAIAGSFGVIGDSLSVGMNADDRCTGVLQCFNKLGAAPTYNFANGDKRWSLSNRLNRETGGVTRSVSAAANGARWDDALNQARELTTDRNLDTVHIELGGNDVCAETLPDIADIGRHIDASFDHLTGTLAGGTVIVSEVPDVVRLRSVMRNQPHFLFKTFQDLWDLNYARFRADAIDEVCAALHGENACSGSRRLRTQTIATIRSFLENDLLKPWRGRFPCHRVLVSDASTRHRKDARRLNRQINDLLAEKALAYDGRNGTRILIANNVEERRYTTVEPSKLDGFHLGRKGHKAFAKMVWDGFKPEEAFATLVTDFTGDRIPEHTVVAVTDSGNVHVHFLDTEGDRLELSYRLGGASPPKAIAVVPKHPGTSKPALALLDNAAGTPRVTLWKIANGTRLGTVNFRSGTPASSLVVVEDLDHNGFAELAVLTTSQNRSWVHIKDVISGAEVDPIRFSSWGEATALLPAPDLNANLTPEIGVFQLRKQDGRARIELRDAATGKLVTRVVFDNGLTPIDYAWVPDQNGDLVPELAVLFLRNSDLAHLLTTRNVVTGKSRSTIRLPTNFAASTVGHVANRRGSGDFEFAVLGLWGETRRVQVRLYDALSHRHSGTLNFGANLTPLNLEVVPLPLKPQVSRIMVLARDRVDQLRAKATDTDNRSAVLDLVIP